MSWDDAASSGERTPVVRAVLIGSYGVGKTALGRRLMDGTYDTNGGTTIGIDYFAKLCVRENVRLNIWDTAGQERFHSVSTSYYRMADVFVLVFNVKNRETFDKVPFYLEEIKKYQRDEGMPVVLVGNMANEELGEPPHGSVPATTSSSISRAEAEAFAMSHGLTYFETSARTNTASVNRLFSSVALLGRSVPARSSSSGVDQPAAVPTSSFSRCC